jgi:hypothetical protein
MASTKENLKRVDEAIEDLNRAVVPTAHDVFSMVKKSVDQIGSAVKLMDEKVDRISRAAVNLAAAQADLTASAVDSTQPRPSATKETRKRR